MIKNLLKMLAARRTERKQKKNMLMIESLISMMKEREREMPKSLPKKEWSACYECAGGGVVQDPMCSMSGCGGGMQCPVCGGSGGSWVENE